MAGRKAGQDNESGHGKNAYETHLQPPEDEDLIIFSIIFRKNICISSRLEIYPPGNKAICCSKNRIRLRMRILHSRDDWRARNARNSRGLSSSLLRMTVEYNDNVAFAAAGKFK